MMTVAETHIQSHIEKALAAIESYDIAEAQHQLYRACRRYRDLRIDEQVGHERVGAASDAIDAAYRLLQTTI